jgi:hypothetical protein
MRDASPAPPAVQPDTHGRSTTRTSTSTALLSPDQQEAFADQIRLKILRELGIESQPSPPSGDAGPSPPSDAPRTSDPSNDQAEWGPEYVTYSETKAAFFPPEAEQASEASEGRQDSTLGEETEYHPGAEHLLYAATVGC